MILWAGLKTRPRRKCDEDYPDLKGSESSPAIRDTITASAVRDRRRYEFRNPLV